MMPKRLRTRRCRAVTLREPPVVCLRDRVVRWRSAPRSVAGVCSPRLSPQAGRCARHTRTAFTKHDVPALERPTGRPARAGGALGRRDGGAGAACDIGRLSGEAGRLGAWSGMWSSWPYCWTACATSCNAISTQCSRRFVDAGTTRAVSSTRATVAASSREGAISKTIQSVSGWTH